MAMFSRLRLVTLPVFPHDAPSRETDSFLNFTAHSISFENHYVQHVDWLRGLTHQHSSHWSGGAIPVANSSFQWLRASDNDATSVFDRLTQDISDETVTLVTVETGYETDLEDPFSSLLIESVVRIPLWIVLPTRNAGSVQTLTGTNDVLSTIARFIDGETSVSSDNSPAHAATEDGAGDAINLVALAEHSCSRIERQLRLETKESEAIRTERFLFARSREKCENTGECRTALYSKPDDLWNIHDVSGEYPETAEALATALTSS